MKLIYYHFYKDGFWFRLWNGHGLVFKNKHQPLLFSERMGITKPFKILGWRISKLNPI